MTSLDYAKKVDHDGSAPPDKVYEYFSMILAALPEPSLHVDHFHSTQGGAWPMYWLPFRPALPTLNRL